MLEIKKIETGRMENGAIVITNTQWGLFQNGHEWSRHDTEAEAITEMAWMSSDDYHLSI
tara:strand:+ start:1307 stop:1483 length:177 start_codon:yes stop_codon:yes gene_type:complete